MDFPPTDLMDRGACYQKLVTLLHPDGLACPTRKAAGRLRVHRRHRAPALDYRCTGCGRVFNACTGAAPAGTRRTPAEVVLILRGFARGVPRPRAPAGAASAHAGQRRAAARSQPAGG